MVSLDPVQHGNQLASALAHEQLTHQHTRERANRAERALVTERARIRQAMVAIDAKAELIHQYIQVDWTQHIPGGCSLALQSRVIELEAMVQELLGSLSSVLP